MRITQTKQGCFLASFWLFGYELKKEFETEKEALLFFENLKASYITDLYSIETCVDKYLTTVSKFKSEGSYKWEQYIFTVFLRYLAISDLGLKSSVTKIRPGTLESFQSYLRDSISLNPATVNRYFSTIKHFFRKLDQWEMISSSPAKFISKLPTKPKEKLVWSEEDFQKVYEKLNIQDKKLLLFLKLTGARLSSATRLRVSDICFKNRVIVLKTQKGSKSELKSYAFPLYDKLFKHLENVMVERNKLLISHDYVFFESPEKEVHSKNFSKRVRKVLSRVCPRNNSEGVLSLHGLRHSMASMLHEGGMTVNEIKGLLGHSSVTITEMYIKSDASTIRSKIDNIA